MTGRGGGSRGDAARSGARAPALGTAVGFTLVEVIVAVVLVAVGLLASVSMMTMAARTLGEARRFSLAAAAAESLADSLVATTAGGVSGRRELSWGRLRWEPGEGRREVRIVAVMPASGSGAEEDGAVILELYVRLPPASATRGPEG